MKLRYFLLVFGLASGPAAAQSTALAKIKQHIEQGCAFTMQIRDGGEFVTIGSDGNILRWGALEGDEARKQQWFLYPDQDGYRIGTLQNGEFMAVGSNGNILRWANANDVTQIFKLVEPSGAYLSLQEPTKGERVAVGSNGNVLRWGRTNGREQQFAFRAIPATCTAMPTALDDASGSPSTVPEEPPELTSAAEETPPRTEEVLVGASFLPALLVNDAELYPNARWRQREGVPFYRLEQWQYWEPVPEGSVWIKANSTMDLELSSTSSLSSSSWDSVRDTIEYSLSGEQTTSASVPLKGAELSASKTLAASFNRSTERSSGSEQSSSSETTNTVKEVISNPSGEDWLYVRWALISEYRLLRGTTGASEPVWSEPLRVVEREFIRSYPSTAKKVEAINSSRKTQD